MHESWYDNELKLLILVRNKNEFLWLLADNVILVVYLKFFFTCLFYSGWIGSGLIRFGSFRIRVYIGSIRVRVRFGSCRNSGHYNFGWVRLWIGSISNFGSKSVQLFLMSIWVWFRIVRFGSLLSGLLMTHIFRSYKQAVVRGPEKFKWWLSGSYSS